MARGTCIYWIANLLLVLVTLGTMTIYKRYSTPDPPSIEYARSRDWIAMLPECNEPGALTPVSPWTEYYLRSYVQFAAIEDSTVVSLSGTNGVFRLPAAVPIRKGHRYAIVACSGGMFIRHVRARGEK